MINALLRVTFNWENKLSCPTILLRIWYTAKTQSLSGMSLATGYGARTGMTASDVDLLQAQSVQSQANKYWNKYFVSQSWKNDALIPLRRQSAHFSHLNIRVNDFSESGTAPSEHGEWWRLLSKESRCSINLRVVRELWYEKVKRSSPSLDMHRPSSHSNQSVKSKDAHNFYFPAFRKLAGSQGCFKECSKVIRHHWC